MLKHEYMYQTKVKYDTMRKPSYYLMVCAAATMLATHIHTHAHARTHARAQSHTHTHTHTHTHNHTHTHTLLSFGLIYYQIIIHM